MFSYDKVKRAILKTDDPTKRKVLFMALLTSALPKAGKAPILTGGSAIEVYLNGTLRTGDMGVVYDVEGVKKILKAWGFELGGLRSYANDELGLAVDLVGEQLNGSYELVTVILTDYGPANVIGIEDMILKRLASAKFWNVPQDIEQCFLLAKSRSETIDWSYLEREAKKADLSDYLEKLRALLPEEERG